MEKYYVSGCRDDGEATVTCEDREATFWTLYARDDKGMSHGIIDLAFREDAEAAMHVYIMRDAHFAAEMVWEKTMMETIGEDGVGSVKAAIERLQAERDALQEQVQKLAADNAAMKSAELIEFLRLVECMNGDHCEGNYGNSHEWIRHIVARQHEYEEKFGDTPWGIASDSKYLSTDAFIREIQTKSELEGMVKGAGRVALEASQVYRVAPQNSDERSLHKTIGNFAHMVARRIRAGEQP